MAESGAYLAYVSIYAASKVQKEYIGTIFRTKSNGDIRITQQESL